MLSIAFTHIVGQLVWIDGCHRYQSLNIDVNPWKSLEALEMWTRSLDS
jgi:hypothetical protein